MPALVGYNSVAASVFLMRKRSIAMHIIFSHMYVVHRLTPVPGDSGQK